MKKTGLFFIVMILIAAGLGIAALRAETSGGTEVNPSPELLQMGNDLFNKKEGLGVKYACILCHQKDKAIQKDKIIQLGDKLPEVINLHIMEKAKGTKPLASDSQEMQALMAYIRYEHSK